MVKKAIDLTKAVVLQRENKKSIAYIHHQSALLSYLVNPAQEGSSPVTCFHFSCVVKKKTRTFLR